MVTSPDNVMFPTLVVGSLPRPQWVRDLVEERKAGRLGEEEASRLLDDAVPLVVRMQEGPGWTSSQTGSGDERATSRSLPTPWTASNPIS